MLQNNLPSLQMLFEILKNISRPWGLSCNFHKNSYFLINPL